MATKNILVLSGGGTKGVFQVGAMQELADLGFLFDGFVGTSTGAIQAGAMSMSDGTAISQQQQLDLLRHVWFSLRKNSDVYKGGVIRAAFRVLFGKPSLFTFEPLRKLLKKYIVEAPKSPVALSTVSLDKFFDDEARPETKEALRTYILCSSSIPVAFPPVTVMDYVDGGIRNITPLSLAFKIAEEIVEPEDEVNIIIINAVHLLSMEGNEFVDEREWKKEKIWEIGERVLQIVEHEIITNDVKYATRINELIGYFDEKGIERPEWLQGKVHANIIQIDPEYEPYGTLEVDPVKIMGFYAHGVFRTREVMKG
jgi:NTE family protein